MNQEARTARMGDRYEMKRVILIGVLLAALTLAGFASPAVRPAAAQAGNVWQAQFFNNIYLLGNTVLTTQYSNLDLYWGASSPGTGVNADNFSARIASDPFFDAGTYRFYILADDAVQLWIDFPPTKQPTLTTFNAPQPGQMLMVDVTLTGGVHHIQLDYREITGDAYLFVRWANLATNPTPPTFPVPIAVATNPWTAQYFGNPTLTGSPSVIQTESSLSHNWGAQAPVSGVPADNFSVRWTSVQTLNGGTYQISVSADDGVRVWVDNALVIDQWHVASGQTYTNTLPLSGGQHAFTVEYYEATGNAFIDFKLAQPGGSTPPSQPPSQPPSSPTGTTATVLAYSLNVRSAPSLTGQILMQVFNGQTYPVLGRNAQSTWFQINANGTVGWVSGAFVSLNNEGALPITDGSSTSTTPPPSASGYIVTARVNLNIRSGPGVSFARLSFLPASVSAQVIGRNATSTWWQIQYGTVTGWISAFFSDLQPGANVNLIPVTG